MEGDYDRIVNRGSLCVKGISMFATHASPNRLQTPRYLPWPSSGSGRHRRTGRRSFMSIRDSPGPPQRRTCTRASGPGIDAAFQNTMMNHILVNKLYDEDYVKTHTNALFLGDQSFNFTDGVFSGFDAESHQYHPETWGYQLDAKGKPRVAASLDDPHCVFSRLKTFVSRYTLGTGERITAIPADQIRQIAEMMSKNRPG